MLPVLITPGDGFVIVMGRVVTFPVTMQSFITVAFVIASILAELIFIRLFWIEEFVGLVNTMPPMVGALLVIELSLNTDW